MAEFYFKTLELEPSTYSDDKQSITKKLCQMLSIDMPQRVMSSSELKVRLTNQTLIEKEIVTVFNEGTPKTKLIDLLNKLNQFDSRIFDITKRCIPLIGTSQSGKSTLFHELLQTDGSTRIGNGVESKTCLCVQQPFKHDYSLVDTPGLMDTRSEYVQLFTQYQLSELMVSGQFPTVVVTLTEKDFLPPFTTNGIRTLMMFFDRFFDLRKMGNGFYESILNDHFNTEGYSEIVERLNAAQALDAQPGEHDELVDAAKAEVQETWNAGLGKIEAAIEAMPTTPFTVFVRDNESDLDEEDQLTPKKLERKIARALNILKKIL